LSHVLRKTLCEHVNGLCPAGWLNEQSITKHWFRSLRTCPYSWATGRNSTYFKIYIVYYIEIPSYLHIVASSERKFLFQDLKYCNGLLEWME